MSTSFIREIVTLQIGHYSNFIGSHWLNLQEASFVYDDSSSTDINHDYLFREGCLQNGQESYVPRLLIIDAKGSLGSLPCLGNLYQSPYVNPSTSEALWSGDVQLVHQMPEEKNDFLKHLEREDAKYVENLDEDKDICLEDYTVPETAGAEQKIFDLSDKVNVWSDYLRPHLHSKSVFLLDDVLHKNIGTTTGDSDESGGGWGFQSGMEVMKKESTEEEVMDRIRILAETCGSLQGFHLLCDAHNGMGGVGASVGQLIADEYNSKDLLSFVSTPPHHKPKNTSEIKIHLTNLIQCYAELGKFSSMLQPLILEGDARKFSPNVVQWPNVSYQEFCPFESSAILASYLETVSVPWRSKTDPLPLSHLTHLLTCQQRKVVGGSFSFPMGIEGDQYLEDWLTEGDSRLRFKSVLGGVDLSLPRVAEVSSIRGIARGRLQRDNKRLKCETAWEVYESHLRRTDAERRQSVARFVSGVRDPLKTATPFPQIFSNQVDSNGYLKQTSETTPSIVTNVPTVANLYQGGGIGTYLKNLLDAGRVLDVTQLPPLSVGQLETDVWKNAVEDFMSIADSYEERNYSETDSD